MKRTIGSIALFIIVLALVFTLFHSLVSYVVQLLNDSAESVADYLGSSNLILARTYSTLSTISKWLASIFTNKFSLAILIIVSTIYMVVTGEKEEDVF